MSPSRGDSGGEEEREKNLSVREKYLSYEDDKGPMNHFKRKAFYQEFPFLTAIEREPEACEQIVVGRVNLDLLHRRPIRCKIVSAGANIAEGDEVWLLAGCGQLLGQVRAEYDWRGPHDTRRSPGETVLEAIDRLDVVEQLCYVVWVEYGYQIVNHCSGPAWRVTIYKPARQIRIAEVVARALAMAQKKVAAETDF